MATKETKNAEVTKKVEEAASLKAYKGSRKEIIEAMKADKNNRVFDIVVRSISVSPQQTTDGKSYYNVIVGFNEEVEAAVKQADGSFEMQAISSLTLSWYQVENVLRRSVYFGRYIEMINQALVAGFISQLLIGVKLSFIAEFIAAGEERANPFNKNENVYDAKDYDRFIYHVIAADKTPEIEPVYAEIGKMQLQMLLDNAKQKLFATAATNTFTAVNNAKDKEEAEASAPNPF